MKRTITTLFTLFTLINLQAQSIDEKVKKLMSADGTMRNIETLISSTIDYQKQMNPGILESFWISLNSELQAEAIPDFVKLVAPIYQESFSEKEIDELIKFYKSAVGKALVSKQPEFIEALNMPLMQWSQNINTQIIDKIENRGNEVPSTNEIEKFEQKFKNEYGLQIVNLAELTLDKEHNPGTLLIDFGDTDGTQNITKSIIVKNNTDSLLTFQKPLFSLNEDIIFEWGDTPLKPKEERALNFILDADEAEGNRYSFMSIRFNQGGSFPIGIKYDIPQKKIEYTISQDSLLFEQFPNSFSKEYEFTVTNTGRKKFKISDIELDKPIAYIYYDRDVIEPQESSKIRVLFTKELISEVEKVELNLKINLTKSEEGEMSSYGNKVIRVKIK